MLGEELTRVCARAVATNSALKGRKRIQCTIVLGMFDGIVGGRADIVGYNPKTMYAGRTQSHTATNEAVGKPLQTYPTMETIATKSEWCTKRSRRNCNG